MSNDIYKWLCLFAAFISTQWTYISRELALKTLDLVVLLPELLSELLDLEAGLLLGDEGDGGEVTEAGQGGERAVACSNSQSVNIDHHHKVNMSPLPSSLVLAASGGCRPCLAVSCLL